MRQNQLSVKADAYDRTVLKECMLPHYSLLPATALSSLRLKDPIMVRHMRDSMILAHPRKHELQRNSSVKGIETDDTNQVQVYGST